MVTTYTKHKNKARSKDNEYVSQGNHSHNNRYLSKRFKESLHKTILQLIGKSRYII